MNVKFHKNCENTGKILKISCERGNFARSSHSIRIGTDLSIDKSIEIGKSDLIDIDWINQSVEIDDTLVSFIDYYILIFTDFIDLYRKIYLFICSFKNEN